MRAFALGLLTAGVVVGAAGLAAQTMVGRFNAWTVYVHESGQARLCFAAAAPNTTEPAGARRTPVYFYISAWPKDGVRAQPSVKIGYPFKKGSDATAMIGTAAFTLFTRDDRALP
jgi:hypothetical protein